MLPNELSESGPPILFGDDFHNFVEGVVIAAAFLIDIPLGVSTVFAVVAREITLEAGDFASLLDSGYASARGRSIFSLMRLLR